MTLHVHQAQAAVGCMSLVLKREMNAVVTERSAERAESRARRPLPVGQPESLTGLRPSQRRAADRWAADRRAALNRRRSIALWLGRFPR